MSDDEPATPRRRRVSFGKVHVRYLENEVEPPSSNTRARRRSSERADETPPPPPPRSRSPKRPASPVRTSPPKSALKPKPALKSPARRVAAQTAGRRQRKLTICVALGAVLVALLSSLKEVTDAYVALFPLALMHETATVIEHIVRGGGCRIIESEVVASGCVCDGEFWNHLLHAHDLPDAGFRAVVRPNVDTLYTSAFLDLDREPALVLTLPRRAARYFGVQAGAASLVPPQSRALAVPPHFSC